jgi:hypothetical protein
VVANKSATNIYPLKLRNHTIGQEAHGHRASRAVQRITALPPVEPITPLTVRAADNLSSVLLEHLGDDYDQGTLM